MYGLFEINRPPVCRTPSHRAALSRTPTQTSLLAGLAISCQSATLKEPRGFQVKLKLKGFLVWSMGISRGLEAA